MTKTNVTELLPAYLVTGTDELKRETVVRRLRDRIAKLGDLSLNSQVFAAESADGTQIVTACNTMPFASPMRLVQVNDADRLKKAEQERIISYLSHPSDTTVLLLVASGVAKNTRLYKAVAALGKTAIIDCAPIKRGELPNRVRAMAVGHGIALTESASNALVDLVGENTVALDAALQKIALSHSGTDPVNDNEVSQMVSRTAEVKPWDFVDAFSGRNLKKCLLLRMRMDSVTSYALMAMCVNRVRELMCAQSLAARGQGGLLAKQLNMPPWRVRNHMAWARGFTAQELREALLSARNAEAAMKSGTDPEEAFQMWYIGVIARKR